MHWCDHQTEQSCHIITVFIWFPPIICRQRFHCTCFQITTIQLVRLVEALDYVFDTTNLRRTCTHPMTRACSLLPVRLMEGPLVSQSNATLSIFTQSLSEGIPYFNDTLVFNVLGDINWVADKAAIGTKGMVYFDFELSRAHDACIHSSLLDHLMRGKQMTITLPITHTNLLG